MPQTLFFYDLETSGLNPRQSRIMQFAGQRTGLDFKPIGEPCNVLVKLNDDTLPDPDAIMVTGVSPQQTQADGYTEAEFVKLLRDEIFTPDTIMVGYNNIRFDDEFVRALLWRNFIDPYEWAWRDGRGRWDLLDVVRMTRALRPDGIEWPVVDGKETNRLELLSKQNGIEHTKAHDALSDVEALIAVTKLIHDKQPQLYGHLFAVKDKTAVKRLVNLDDKRPFVYVSGRYDGAHHKATVAFPLTGGRNGNVVVYDLRYDPSPFLDLTAAQVKARLFATREDRQKNDFLAVPVKELQYNRAPAVAPIGVLERDGGWERLGLTADTITKHRNLLLSSPAFAENVRSAYESRPAFERDGDPEGQLYDGFVSDLDKQRISQVAEAGADELVDLHPAFDDDRLPALLLHYKARNYPRSLSEDEQLAWEAWRGDRIRKQLPQFLRRLQALAADADDERSFLLQELQLWAESIVPLDD